MQEAARTCCSLPSSFFVGGRVDLQDQHGHRQKIIKLKDTSMSVQPDHLLHVLEWGSGMSIVGVVGSKSAATVVACCRPRNRLAPCYSAMVNPAA